MSNPNGIAAFEQCGRVMKWPASSFVAIDEADEQRRIPDSGMELFYNLESLRNKPRFENQVLRRVTGDCELGCDDKLGAGGRKPFVGLEDPFRVALQVTNRGIKLCETDLHARLPSAGYARLSGRQYPFVSPLGRVHYRVVLIALVQSVVCTLHKHLGPLNECRSQEPAKGAQDNFLKKRGLHL